ncbi:D-alanyl-D-alanine carboxypeptidase [Secundilactobacillus odoratitofui DSM 19909 = JCM 15043]|uniref:D-alanyl-D-alanine carboxypeptidase n=1 Tax=Secundilactobacillus odoratitofui DSM 19909 = JCM 15043 TaxID=1423776 RepID=A0A0R1M467_9LACO|nr:D-alanyl-D-alanine carboxypeptidase family protein [Secundilactobacillus odoratitofui]KRK98647.1 D-alanyl-D-alanine carboxypeptidase [Secundilactobacillus odoratitofui DSM 19909 = JCM 15043]
MVFKTVKSRFQIGLFACVFFIMMLLGGLTANASSLNLQVKSAIAIDADTGQVLYQKNDAKSLPVASMTKLLSTYIVLQQIKSGKLHWNSRVKISPAVAKLSRNTELTNVPLSAKRTYSVRELYQATLIYSANAAITALGNKVAGSPHQFVSLMRKTAKQLHLNSAKLITASGITNGQAASLGYASLPKKDENTMSASDVAKLAQDLLKTYPEILQTTSQAKMWFDKGGSSQTEMTNWNLLLKGETQYDATLPVDGLKTGTSTAAGGNFVGTVKKNGHRIITVVMHAANKSTGDPSRFVQTKRLMKWVYATYKPIALTTKTYQLSDIKVPMGKTTTTSATVAKPATVWIRKQQTTKQLKSSVTIDSAYQAKKGGLKAPIKANTTFGVTKLTLAGQSIPQVGQSGTMRLPIKTTVSVNQANWIVRTWRNFVALF